MCRKLIYLISLVLLLGLAADMANADITTGLVGYWKFDGNANDSSGNNYHGEEYGSPSYVPGMIGQAMEFNGSQSVYIEDFTGIQNQDEVTVCMWVKADRGTGSDQVMWFVDQDGDYGRARMRIEGGDFEQRWGDGGGNPTVGSPVITGEWTHLASVRKNRVKLELFVNGESVDEEAYGVAGAAEAQISIGAERRSPTSVRDPFDGAIDEVRVYSRALSAADIQELFAFTGASPAVASNPDPADGQTDVPRDVVLAWTPGEFAPPINGHTVYLSESFNDVNDGIGGIAQNASSYAPPQRLDFSKTYYWRVDEVNDAETPTTWQGDIWNFTTPDSLVVDDFELYNDLNTDEPGSNRIFYTWIDGYDNPAINGSVVGYADPPFAEQSIVYGGNQSMPFFYSNTGGAAYSEAERTFAVPQNWTKAGVQTLVLYFHGTPGNTGQLYVKVNGSKVVYDGDAADITQAWWHQWNIDLASLGVDLQNVTTLSIGMDGNGASGTLYFDDIRLALSFPATGVRSGSILFVSSLEAEHMPGDDAIKAFFEGLGHAVTYIDDDADEAPTEAAAAAADLVYISESVGSGDIKNEITEIETPIIVAEPYAWDEMGLTTANPEAIDQVPASVNITIINAGHPLAAGYSGDVPVFTALSGSDELIPVGTTGGGAVVIARGSGNTQTDADVYFVYEKGAALAAPPADGSPQVAADIRIGFFAASPTAEELLSNEGYDLLSAAVNYALGITE